MIGIILLIIISIRIYKTAKASGRNATLWTVAAVVAYIGIQVGVVLGCAVIVFAGHELWGWSEDYSNKYLLLINAVSVILSLFGLLLVSYYAGKPFKKDFVAPPPPPIFGEK